MRDVFYHLPDYEFDERLVFPFQVIHMHFWLKRREICTQIEGWIADLAKLQLTERVDRSMVLRRQYRQLREELAKLPMPPGMEDLDQPFSASVQNTSSAVDLPATPSVASVASTASDSTQLMSSDTANDFITITQLSGTDVNLNDMENHGLG